MHADPGNKATDHDTPDDSAGMTRQAFMQRVRSDLGHAHTAPPTDPPAVDDATVRLVSAQGDVLRLFVSWAADTGMSVETLAGAALTKRVLALVEELGIRRAVVATGSVPAAISLREALRRKGVSLVDTRSAVGMAGQFDADAGITDVHAAIAETGSLVCCADAGHPRGASLAPGVHIAIVRRSDIVPDLLDYLRRFDSIGPPASAAIITGPSKTADIEGILVQGVHGPGKVVVLVVEDE